MTKLSLPFRVCLRYTTRFLNFLQYRLLFQGDFLSPPLPIWNKNEIPDTRQPLNTYTYKEKKQDIKINMKKIQM
jgi:hypothetical protein